MRLFCWTCHKSVSNEVPDETVLRAICICPECIEAGKILFPEDSVHITWNEKGERVVTKKP
jgi:hypothetical protein